MINTIILIKFEQSNKKRYSFRTRYNIGVNHPLYGKHHSDATKKKISDSCIGRVGTWKDKKMPPEMIEKLKKSHLGKKTPLQIREKMSKAQLKIDSNNDINWNGFTTPLYQRIRKSPEYLKWRYDVFRRDNLTCVLCGKNKCYVEADHYPKKFSEILRKNNITFLEDSLNCQELWDINNGRTLCKDCHNKNRK